jgi:membrane fusion protein, multidrug efflux system
MKSNSGIMRPLLIGVVILLILFAAWHWLPMFKKPEASKAPPPIGVDVAQVKRSDVPVYQQGLGTVQAFYTVTVTARVDGRLDSVAFTEGQHVNKGALLAQIDPRPFQAALDQARATQDKDAAQLANARLDLQRYEALAPDQLASKQTVDTQRALVNQLEAQVKGDKAAIDNARTQLDYTTITSPISGRTGIRQVDPGNNVHASDVNGIVVVTQLQPITVIFSLPEETFEEVAAALRRGPVQAIAVSRDQNDELDHGTLSLIDNQIDQTTATIRLKATFPNTQGKLWPGQFVNVKVQTQIKHDALTIPAAALQRGPNGMFAYVVGPDLKAKVAALTLGPQTADVAVVDSGLQAGQQVVITNQYRLQPDTLVCVRVQGKPCAQQAAGQQTSAGPAAPAKAPAQEQPKQGASQ